VLLLLPLLLLDSSTARTSMAYVQSN